MRTSSLLLVAGFLWVGLVSPAAPRADFVHFRHAGDASPTEEGWIRDGFTNPNVTDGPTGSGAWFVDDASTASGSTGSFRAVPSAHLLAAQSGWRMRVRLRVQHGADTSTNASAFFEYSNGTKRYVVRFGTSGGETTLRPDGASQLTVGSAAEFHTVELLSRNGESAELFVDGVSRLAAYAGVNAGAVGPRVVWGSADSSNTARGEYALVEWATPHLQLASGLDGVPNPEVDGRWVVWNQRPDVMALDANRPISSDNPIQLAANAVGSSEPQIDAPWVVWHASGQSGIDLFAYDLRLEPSASNPFRFTDDSESDLDPRIDGTWVVWEKGFNDVFAYDLSQGPSGTPFQLSSDFSNSEPQVAGTWAVWSQSRDVIWAYDLTEGPGGTPISLSSQDNQSDTDPQIDDDWVVWEGSGESSLEIFAYDLSEPASQDNPVQLTDDAISDRDPQIDGSWIVWEARTGSGDTTLEIFAYDLSQPASPDNPLRLTDNGLIDTEPWVGGGRAAWVRGVAGVSADIYTYDLEDAPLAEAVRLTDNTFFDLGPRVDGARVVWNGLDTRGDADPSNDLDSAFLAPEPGAAALATTALATLGLLARRARRR